jgi:Flp pilus assembly protein TadD
MQRAWTRLVSGDRVGALSMVSSAARVVPSTWWALNNLGLAQRETGYFAEAEATFRAAARALDPEPPVALVNLGTLLMHRGRPDEAVPILERAVRSSSGPVRDEATLAWALALERSGRRAEAIEALEDAGGESGRLGARVRPRLQRILSQAAFVTPVDGAGRAN